MNTEEFYAGAYWGSRQEPLEECTHRLLKFLTEIAKVDPVFARWYAWDAEEVDAVPL
jgi:hypothetical protein